MVLADVGPAGLAVPVLPSRLFADDEHVRVLPGIYYHHHHDRPRNARPGVRAETDNVIDSLTVNTRVTAATGLVVLGTFLAVGALILLLHHLLNKPKE